MKGFIDFLAWAAVVIFVCYAIDCIQSHWSLIRWLP